MNISCPNCGASHPVDPCLIDEDGLFFKCQNCCQGINIKRKRQHFSDYGKNTNTQRKIDPPLKRVLIIDDAVFFRTMLREILESEGCAVLLAINGREGIELLKQECFDVDLIILDLQLPEISGFEVLQEIKNDSRGKKTPVLVMTGVHKQSEAVAMVRELGAAGYVSKENSADHFRFRIKQILFPDY